MLVLYFRIASNMVDGNDDPDSDNLSCALTGSYVPPWLVVDLEHVFNIIGVAIVNRNMYSMFQYKNQTTSVH